MWHRQGKVSLTKGSDVVTGVGTNWVENIRVGDAFQGPDGKLYQVINVASNEALAISPAYEGNTAMNLNYWVVPIPGYSKIQADRLSLIISKLDGDIVTATEAADRAQVAAIQAQQWKVEAASSAAAALQSEKNAALSADIAEQARDDAVSVVTDGQGSITPAPGKFPVAGAAGTVQRSWVHELDFALDKLRVATNKTLYGDGPYPVIDLQFQGAKYLDPRVDFSRASLDWDEHGNEYGINQPALTDKGLWCSGKRANLLRGSGDMSKEPWSRGPQYFANVSNTPTPFRLYDTDFVVHYGPNVGQSSFTNHLPYQIVNLATAGKYTVSFYVKKIGLTTHLRLLPDNGSTTNQETTGGSVLLSGSGEDLDLVNSDTTVFSGTRSLKTIPAGDGWYKCILTFSTKIDGVKFRFRAFPYVGATPVFGDGESGLLMTQVKLEAGAIDNPYIPTNESQVVVASTDVTIPVDGLFEQGAGSVVVDMYMLGPRSTAGFAIAMFGNSATKDYIGFGYGMDNPTAFFVVSGGETTTGTIGQNQPKYNEWVKMAFVWSGSDFAIFCKGERVVSMTHTAEMPRFQKLNIGKRFSAFRSPVNVKSLQLYQERLSDQRLEELTS